MGILNKLNKAKEIITINYICLKKREIKFSKKKSNKYEMNYKTEKQKRFKLFKNMKAYLKIWRNQQNLKINCIF